MIAAILATFDFHRFDGHIFAATSGIEPSQIILLLLLLLVISAMLWSARRKPKSPKFNPDAFERKDFAAMKDRRGMQGDLQELIIELEELSRKINAQIDTKFAKLEASIMHADKRIEALRSLIQQGTGQSDVDVMIDDERDESAPNDSDSRVPADPRHAQVYALADARKSSTEIACETGIPTGEVELILALRNP
jgi:hypothetical protein